MKEQILPDVANREWEMTGDRQGRTPLWSLNPHSSDAGAELDHFGAVAKRMEDSPQSFFFSFFFLVLGILFLG